MSRGSGSSDEGNSLTLGLAVLLLGVVAATAVPGTAVADEPLTDGGTYWQGQTLTYENGLSAGETVRVFGEPDGGIVSEATADANGVATIHTDNMDGQYRLEDADGSELATFSVDVATLTADPSSVQVTNDGGPNAEADVTLTTQRTGATVAVESDDLPEDRIVDVFDTDEVTLTDGELTLTGDFTDVEPGTYDVDFVMQNGTASAGVAVTVMAPSTADQSSPATAATATQSDREAEQAAEEQAEQVTADRPDGGGETATTPQRGFLSNGEGGPLSNVMNLTVLGFLLSAFGIVYQLMEGR